MTIEELETTGFGDNIVFYEMTNSLAYEQDTDSTLLDELSKAQEIAELSEDGISYLVIKIVDDKR